MTNGNSSMKRALLSSLAYLLCIIYSNGATAASGIESIDELPLVALGQLSHKDGAIEVNGQKIIRDSATIVAKESDGRTARLRQGDYVAVAGDVVEPGKSLATSIIILNEEYVDGASPTYVRAEIDRATSDGFAYSANSKIDLTPSMHEGGSSSGFSTGDIAEFSGISVDGLLLASAATSLTRSASVTSGRLGSSVRGIRGSGVRGIRGSGVRGIRGSGVRGIRGSGVRGIRGSGVRGIRGSGVRGIRGSGVRGIRGSGVRGIRGSGVRGIRGSGVRGIRGSGVRGIRGSGVRGIRGSGVRGIRGSGVRGIRGSGVRGIRGSGVRGIRGSGAR